MFKKAQVMISSCELWGNKCDGLRVSFMKVHLMDTRIKQNNHAAIFYENRVSEQMVKIYGVNHESS